MEQNYKRKVLVTGFGPFNEHEINASWEAVKILPELKVEGVEFVIEEIPVTYKDVDEKVKILWEEHSPTLVVHVGVSNKTEIIQIESIANRSGYIKKDCDGVLHATGECLSIGEDTIECQIDVPRICENVNNNGTNIITAVSTDAGRYLCEYIFYKSLHINKKRTLFVHVPVLEKPYTAQELALGIKNIIQEALKQLEECICSNGV